MLIRPITESYINLNMLIIQSMLSRAQSFETVVQNYNSNLNTTSENFNTRELFFQDFRLYEQLYIYNTK